MAGIRGNGKEVRCVLLRFNIFRGRGADFGIGDIVGLKVLGTNIVLLDAEDDAKALLITRNANYSQRFTSPMIKL